MTFLSRKASRPVVMASMLLLGGTASFAQGIITGTLTGEVQDATGAILPDAQITVLNTATGVSTPSKSDKAGVFNFPTLPVGKYKVTIQTPGFDILNLDNVQIDANRTTSLGTEKLTLGKTSETVEVSSSAALLETSQAQVSTTFQAEEITDLPTGGGLDRLALLIPGVVRTLGDNYSNTNGVGFSANGQRGRSNNFEIDGQTNNDNSVTGPQVFFRNEDALQEVQVLTENFGAQYGRNSGTIVNYITKSGTNQFHGTGFYNYTPSFLSSLTQGQKGQIFGYCAPGASLIAGTNSACTPVVKPRFVGHEWGGTLGGPILKDKLFGFGGALFRHNTNGANPSISSTLFPTPNGLQQLQTAFPGNPFVASLVNQGPFSVAAGNPKVVSTSNFNVCASTGTCPSGSPSVEFGTIQRSLLSYNTDEEVIGRLDYQATQRDRFFARYIYQNAPTYVSGGTISSGTYYNSFDVAHSAGADWTHTFGPRWVNQVRYGFQQTAITFGGGAFPTCTVTDLSGCPSTISFGTIASGISGLGYGFATNIPQGRIVKTSQVQDNVTASIGKHAITWGGEFDSQNSPNTFLPYTNGSFTFTTFNSALAGVGTLNLANGNPQIPFKENDYALYFQDDWKATPQLTLNLGLRWEFFGQAENILHNLTVARQNSSTAIWDTSLSQNLTTLPQEPDHWKYFQPRIGFAYAPASMPSLVVRGGFAINFDPQFYNIFLNVYSSAPVVNTGIISCNGTTINCLPSGGTTNALVNAQDGKYNPSGAGVNPGTKSQTNVGVPFSNPYTETYTLGIQKQVSRFAVAEVRYVGNHNVKNFQTLNSNPALNVTAGLPTGLRTLGQAFPNLFPSSLYCTTAGSIGLGRPDCNRTYVTTRANTAFSVYSSLQSSLTTRELHGLSGIVSYTYSRSIDNTSETYSSGTSGANTIAVAPNPFNTNYAERGVSAQSFPNVASAGLVYKLHIFESQKGLVGHLLGGYQANVDWSYNSGQPFTPYQSYVAPASLAGGITLSNQARYSFCDYFYDMNVLGADSCRPILVNPAAAKGSVGINAGPTLGYRDLKTGAPISRTTDQWLVNNQYEALALGNPFPGVSRNTLRGNTVNNVDMGVFKTVHIAERVSGQLRVNANNIFNRAYYGPPDVVLGDYVPTRTTNTGSAQYVSTFLNYQGQAGGAVSTLAGRGTRNIQLGAKIIF